jgi:hypothetical protein
MPAASPQKRCSPLAFSSFFNDTFFLDYFKDYSLDSGVTTNQENNALIEYSNFGCGILGLKGLQVQQYAIFETNGKFAIPRHIITEILEDAPEAGRCYCYFINIAQQDGFHKQILIRTKDTISIIDANFSNVFVLAPFEYFEGNAINRITNLSVLMSVHDSKWIFGTEGYDENLLKHLLI